MDNSLQGTPMTCGYQDGILIYDEDGARQVFSIDFLMHVFKLGRISVLFKQER